MEEIYRNLAASLAPAEIQANESRLNDFAKGVEAEYTRLAKWHWIDEERPKESYVYLLRDAKGYFSLGYYDVDTDRWTYNEEGPYSIKCPTRWRMIEEIEIEAI